MSTVAELFRLGGPLMWPLSLCSVLLMGFLIERAITAAGPVWRTDERQRTLHRRHLLFFVEVAPALGLLGTMQGIIECFQVLGGSGPASGALDGLGVACITTVYGLVIALAAQVASYVLDSLGRVDGTQGDALVVARAPTAAAPAAPTPSAEPCVNMNRVEAQSGPQMTATLGTGDPAASSPSGSSKDVAP